MAGNLVGDGLIEENVYGPLQLNVLPTAALAKSFNVSPEHTGLLLLAVTVGVEVIFTLVTPKEEQLPNVATTL